MSITAMKIPGEVCSNKGNMHTDDYDLAKHTKAFYRDRDALLTIGWQMIGKVEALMVEELTGSGSMGPMLADPINRLEYFYDVLGKFIKKAKRDEAEWRKGLEKF